MSEHSKPIKPGEHRTCTVNGQLISMYHVCNGAFTHVQVRPAAGGPATYAKSHMGESDAVRDYAARVASA